MPEVRYTKYTDLEGNVRLIPYNVPTQQENLESLHRFPLIIATGYYNAMGEGSTAWLVAGRFKDEEEMKLWLTEGRNVDPYYFSTFKFYINKLPPKEEQIYKMLASELVKEHWANILDGKEESGHYRFFCMDYANFS